MCQSKDEYLMLREEIIHLDALTNNILNFFYIFMATYISVVLDKNDTIYILMTHIVIIPAYLIVIGKRMATCKISAYMLVFLEGEDFNWETRKLRSKSRSVPIIFHFIHSTHFPFIFVNIAVFILWFSGSNWGIPLTSYEMGKLIIEIVCLLVFLILLIENRKISINDYIDKWEKVKAEPLNNNDINTLEVKRYNIMKKYRPYNFDEKHEYEIYSKIGKKYHKGRAGKNRKDNEEELSLDKYLDWEKYFKEKFLLDENNDCNFKHYLNKILRENQKCKEGIKSLVIPIYVALITILLTMYSTMGFPIEILLATLMLGIMLITIIS